MTVGMIDLREHDSSANREAALLWGRLRQLRVRLMRQWLTARVLLVTTIATILPLLIVIADHLRRGGVPDRARHTLVAAWCLSVVATLIGLVVAAHRFPPSLFFVAGRLERLLRIRHNALINAVLLRRTPHASHAAAAAEQQANQALKAAGPADEQAYRRSWWPEIALAAALALWLLYTAAAPKPVGPSLARLFGADQPAPTATRLRLTRPGPDDIVHAGDALDVELEVLGQPADRVTLDLLADDGSARRQYSSSEPTAPAGRHYRFALAPFEVTADIHFRAAAGDGELTGTIPVWPQPDVATLAITTQPPAYTGLAPEKTAGPDLTVLDGTEARFELVANTPLADAVFVFENGVGRETRTRMTVDRNTSEMAQVAIRLAESGQYRLEFSDRWGYPRPDPPRHSITVTPDLAPIVRIVEPAPGAWPDDVVDVTRVSKLEVDARDDVAVHELVLIWQAEAGLQRMPLLNAGANPASQVRATASTAAVPLQPGESMSVWVEARDARVSIEGRPASQTGRSRVITLIRPIEQPEAGGGPNDAESDRAAGDDRDPPEKAGDDDSEITSDQPADAGMPSDNGQPQGDTNKDETPDATDTPQGESEAGGSPPAAGEGDTGDHPPSEPTEELANGASSPDTDAGNKASTGSSVGSPPAGETSRAGGGPAGGPAVETGEPATSPPKRDPAPLPVSGSDAPLDSTGAAEMVDLLEMYQRGELNEELLVERGWSREHAAAFIQAIERTALATPPGAAINPELVPFDIRLGETDVQAGEGFAADASPTIDSSAPSGKRRTAGATPHEPRVPAELVPLLEAYYRALAQQPGQATTPRQAAPSGLSTRVRAEYNARGEW